jgi:pimeloyl-ACP methyl ester carboxylesterase
LGQALAAHQYAFLAVNTRGHDFGTLLIPSDRAPYLGGAAWERLEESPHDLAAWIDFALEHGFPAVILGGHSIGAIKVTAYLAERRDARVRGLVLASPPLRPAWDTRAFPDALAQASQMAADGQPEALFAGPWGPVSAQTYLSFDQFGFDQFGRDTASPNLGRVRCPVLALLGSNEQHVGTRADLEIIQRSAVAAQRVETRWIEGADHFYAGHELEVAAILAHWASML